MSLSMDSRCIHGDIHKNRDELCSISYPIYQTASFSHLTPGHNLSGFDYSRETNPTRAYLEETMSSLEGAADSIAFSTGMAAVALMLDYFKPGDHIICGEDLYGGVVRYNKLICEKNGLLIDYVDTRDPANIEKAVRKETRLIYFETPSNPMMQVTDIKKAAEIAHANGALLAVDNTFMTPYFQNPIELGADLVIHSGTKYLGGHNDTLCGFLCVKDKELAAEYRLLSKTTGAILAPLEAWLIMRGLKTLHIRMERHKSNADEIFNWLRDQNWVRRIFFIGDKDHPQYELNASQSRGYSGMISFETDTKERALHILESVKLITFAESLGGTESLLTYPTVQTHPDVPDEAKKALGISDRLLRLSVGLEGADDLIRDLEMAV
ncbi:MAG: aminotransferase class V-fold PLP-dependent enzyme [Lachnospiraceae bacterium]|nr:aminotransferase class V-fold PLP-dependent enzyme [Lachnospiraceae bacterium]